MAVAAAIFAVADVAGAAAAEAMADVAAVIVSAAIVSVVTALYVGAVIFAATAIAAAPGKAAATVVADVAVATVTTGKAFTAGLKSLFARTIAAVTMTSAVVITLLLWLVCIVKVLSGIAKYRQVSQSIVRYCQELSQLKKETLFKF